MMAWERPVVESWKESWTKSTGRVEVFSRVIRIVDLMEERKGERRRSAREGDATNKARMVEASVRCRTHSSPS